MEKQKEMFSTRTARKCAEISRILEKEESRSHVRRVTVVLKKKEADRSDEEKQLLRDSVDIVLNIEKRANSRMLTKQRQLEIEDSEDILREKCARLAAAIRDACHLVIYTGAGISTAASIPDYRGPNGVWTLLQQGKEVIIPQLSDAVPTYTHMCVTNLYRKDLVKHVVSQNCDALHLRSGLPRHALSELHGNMHIEVCNACEHPREYIRLFDLTEKTGVRRHQTGRKCSHCGAPLQDTIVHFGEKGRLTSPYNWKEAARAADHADVILCLGSSLKVLKKYPCLWSMHKAPAERPKLYIVNLQWTPKDDVAALKINGRSDDVMKYVMTYLDLPEPVQSYVREEDPIFLMATPLTPDELETTSTKSLVEPPGYRRERVEAILLGDIAASKKLSNSGKNRQKRKKETDSGSAVSRKGTGKKNGSLTKEEKCDVDMEIEKVDVTRESKRCRKEACVGHHLEPKLCSYHCVNVTTQDGVQTGNRTVHDMSTSDTSAAQSDSAATHSSQGGKSSGVLISHCWDNDDAICDISAKAENYSGMACELCETVGMAGSISGWNDDISSGNSSGKNLGQGGNCMLEHAYCRSCGPSDWSVMKRPIQNQQPDEWCNTSTCQRVIKRVALSCGSGNLSAVSSVTVIPATASVPTSTCTPTTTDSQSFTHLRTRTAHSPGCSSVGRSCTNDESSMPNCLSGIDVSCSDDPSHSIIGDGECAVPTSLGYAHSALTASAAQSRLAQTFCPAQECAASTSCNLAESALSDEAKTLANGKYPTVPDALWLHISPKQNSEGYLGRSELTACTSTQDCRELKSECKPLFAPGGATADYAVSINGSCKPQVKTSREYNVVSSCDSSTKYATSRMSGSQECSKSCLSASSLAPGVNASGSFNENEGEIGKVVSGDGKVALVPDTRRNTITATSPGWFGKGLSLRKARRKKSW